VDRSTNVEQSAAGAARRFNALADPSRLAILGRLQAGTRCVCELRDELGMAPNLLSYHLRILREAGFVAGSRNGRRIEYVLLPLAFQSVRHDIEGLSVVAATS